MMAKSGTFRILSSIILHLSTHFTSLYFIFVQLRMLLYMLDIRKDKSSARMF